MSKSIIKLYPDNVLRKKTKKVTSFDKTLHQLLKKMTAEMQRQKMGIGIAAPQIGVSRRVAIVDVSARVKGSKRLELVNPEITESGGQVVSREGCMSLPEYTANVTRYEWIRLKWCDPEGKEHSKKFVGIEARCIQHEVDHLDGKLFFDRVSMLKTDMIPRRK